MAWQPIERKDIKIGDYIKTEWKGKKYEGTVIKLNPQEWARKTFGRFIAVDLKMPSGRIVGMPWTSRASYEIDPSKSKRVVPKPEKKGKKEEKPLAPRKEEKKEKLPGIYKMWAQKFPGLEDSLRYELEQERKRSKTFAEEIFYGGKKMNERNFLKLIKDLSEQTVMPPSATTVVPAPKTSSSATTKTVSNIKDVLKANSTDTIVKMAQANPNFKKQVITFVEQKAGEAKQLLGAPKYELLKTKLAESIGMFKELAKSPSVAEMLYPIDEEDDDEDYVEIPEDDEIEDDDYVEIPEDDEEDYDFEDEKEFDEYDDEYEEEYGDEDIENEEALVERRLSFKEKARLPKSAFALPKTYFTEREKKRPGGLKGKYPIHDRRHAANALQRAKQQLNKGNLTREQYETIVRKVCRKYPDFGTCEKRKLREWIEMMEMEENTNNLNEVIGGPAGALLGKALVNLYSKFISAYGLTNGILYATAAAFLIIGATTFGVMWLSELLFGGRRELDYQIEKLKAALRRMPFIGKDWLLNKALEKGNVEKAIKYIKKNKEMKELIERLKEADKEERAKIKRALAMKVKDAIIKWTTVLPKDVWKKVKTQIAK